VPPSSSTPTSEIRSRLDISDPKFGLFVFDPRVALTWREVRLSCVALAGGFSDLPRASGK